MVNGDLGYNLDPIDINSLLYIRYYTGFFFSLMYSLLMTFQCDDTHVVIKL